MNLFVLRVSEVLDTYLVIRANIYKGKSLYRPYFDKEPIHADCPYVDLLLIPMNLRMFTFFSLYNLHSRLSALAYRNIVILVFGCAGIVLDDGCVYMAVGFDPWYTNRSMFIYLHV